MVGKSELIVRISGDSKKLSNEYKKVAKQTAELESQISAATKASAAAFVGFAGAIGLAANEAAKMETIGVQFEVLTGSAEKAKQTVEDLTDFAAKTPFQFASVAKAGQQLLGFQVPAEKITETLQKIGDVSAAVGAPMNDLTLIFGQVKAAGKLTGERLLQLQERAIPIGPALAQSLGVAETSIKDLVSKGKVSFEDFEKAFSSISEKGGVAFEGMAKRSQTLEGVLSTLGDNFSLLSADIGKQFLPILKLAAESLTKLIQFLRENEVVASFTAKLLGMGAVLSGLATVLGVGALAFLKLRAAMLAAQVGTLSLGVAVKSLVGATGIGLLIVVAAEIFSRWDQIFPAMRDIFEDFADSTIKWFNVLGTAFGSFIKLVGEIASAYIGIWKSALTFDFDGVKENIAKLKDTLLDGVGKIADDVKKEIENQDNLIEVKVAARKAERGEDKKEETGEDPGSAAEKEAARVAAAEKAKTDAINEEAKGRIAILKQEQEVLKATRDGATKEQIEFIKRRQELENEAAEIASIKSEEEKAIALENLRIKNDELLEEQRVQKTRERELQAELREEDAELAAELAEIEKEARTAKDQEELEELRNSLLTKQEARDAVRQEKIQKDIAARNQELKDEEKHGKAVAKLNKFLQSEEVKGVEQGNAQLIKLQQSKNNTLKGIGKAAAVTQIGIDTAKGAVAAYTGFATIPIVGVALGIAAAAGVVAYGAEQIGNVLAANRGGRVPRTPGSIPGVDSVAATLTPGELIVPDQNFDEVVNAVANQRAGRADSAQVQGSGSGGNSPTTININGDVLADEAFIDQLIDGINTAVEERNATLSATAVI